MTSGNPTSLMYTSSADGAGWAVPVPVAQETSIQGLRLAAGPGGQGLAIWDRGSAGNMVRAARVPPPPPPPPSPGPTAAFTYAPHDVCNGLITFDASGSQPAGAPIVDYRWVMHDVGVAEVGGWFNPVSVEVVPTPMTSTPGASPARRGALTGPGSVTRETTRSLPSPGRTWTSI